MSGDIPRAILDRNFAAERYETLLYSHLPPARLYELPPAGPRSMKRMRVGDLWHFRRALRLIPAFRQNNTTLTLRFYAFETCEDKYYIVDLFFDMDNHAYVKVREVA